MEECRHDGCAKPADYPHNECYRHRVMSVGFSLRAPAVQGQFHRTVNDYKLEQFGTTSDKELAERGIVRASEYTHDRRI
jgi:hypothetical protein